MRLQVLGCGDAFGSGGRFHTCFHVDIPVDASGDAFLIDCGAAALIARSEGRGQRVRTSPSSAAM